MYIRCIHFKQQHGLDIHTQNTSTAYMKHNVCILLHINIKHINDVLHVYPTISYIHSKKKQ